VSHSCSSSLRDRRLSVGLSYVARAVRYSLLGIRSDLRCGFVDSVVTIPGPCDDLALLSWAAAVSSRCRRAGKEAVLALGGTVLAVHVFGGKESSRLSSGPCSSSSNPTSSHAIAPTSARLRLDAEAYGLDAVKIGDGRSRAVITRRSVARAGTLANPHLGRGAAAPELQEAPGNPDVLRPSSAWIWTGFAVGTRVASYAAERELD
jgi:hypothetical protein